MKSFRDIRVIPVVLVAIFGLVVLKIAGLVIDGGYVFEYQPRAPRNSGCRLFAKLAQNASRALCVY